MEHLHDIIPVFTSLGEEFKKTAKNFNDSDRKGTGSDNGLSGSIEKSYLHNPWFIPDFVRFAFDAWSEALTKPKLEKWLGAYETMQGISSDKLTVGLVLAGNIPLVGLHDLLCVLASGHNANIKLSSQDDQLIPAVLDYLCYLDPGLKDRFSYTVGRLGSFDAVIATGSNNASRYFDYYFAKYPSIIRRNRNGIAVLTGEETTDDLSDLADDIFLYFGLGCRNVSKIYVPEGYPIDNLFQHFSGYAHFADLHKYRNNYDYQKSILLINRVPHLDNGFLLVREEGSLMSPISVLHYEQYKSTGDLKSGLEHLQDQIQCVVADQEIFPGAIPFGKSQMPELWDYADSIDTMDFLMKL